MGATTKKGKKARSSSVPLTDGPEEKMHTSRKGAGSSHPVKVATVGRARACTHTNTREVPFPVCARHSFAAALSPFHREPWLLFDSLILQIQINLEPDIPEGGGDEEVVKPSSPSQRPPTGGEEKRGGKDVASAQGDADAQSGMNPGGKNGGEEYADDFE